MQQEIDLNQCEWLLAGWAPELWRMRRTMELGIAPDAEFSNLPCRVPGSVQRTLREAGILPDWNCEFNARACEWVENRVWIYSCRTPELAAATRYELCLDRPDSSGWILWDSEIVAAFDGAHRTHIITLPETVGAGVHRLDIAFDLSPRWMGQFGKTSEFGVSRARYNYTWDWIPRLLQIGIVGGVSLREAAAPRIETRSLNTGLDFLFFRADCVNLPPRESVTLSLYDDAGGTVRRETFSVAELADGVRLSDLEVRRWEMTGVGAQTRYRFRVECATGAAREYRVGFREVRRERNPGAPEAADPWLFIVNGRPEFIQGINWTPVLPHYADVAPEHYRALIEKYKSIGVNLFRVWGGASREADCFYDLCDEAGILVWQEFPLSSSGVENLPPDDPATIGAMREIVDDYVAALTPHPCLMMWCGGNELLYPKPGLNPCSGSEPMLRMMAERLREIDPERIFVPASASGPSEWGESKNFGKGVHYDVHGPWNSHGRLEKEWIGYWENDDALFRSEVGMPGAANEALIRRYAGTLPLLPISEANPIWRMPLSWWLQSMDFEEEFGRAPASLGEYVIWSQERQARALAHAAACCRKRFPRCGGIIFWMGHDSFPCPANTSIIDFDGNLKPAAHAIGQLFKTHAVIN